MAVRPESVIKKGVAAHQLHILHCLVSATPCSVTANRRAKSSRARITLYASHAEDIFKVHFRVEREVVGSGSGRWGGVVVGQGGE